MAHVPESEIAVLRQCAPQLLSALTVEQETLPGQLSDPDWLSVKEPWYTSSVKEHKDFTGDQALVALAVSRVSATVRAIKHQTDPEMNRLFGPPPDLLVTTPSSAWLGKGVAMATGLDSIALVERNGVAEPLLHQSELFADRKRLLVIGSVFGIETDVAVTRSTPDILGRCIGVLTLVDDQASGAWERSAVPRYAVLGRLPTPVAAV